jgi:hypothetical protein
MSDSSYGDSVINLSLSINCHNEDCKHLFVPTDKRFRYCPNCRDKHKSTPKSGGHKRTANVISPLAEVNLPKKAKGEDFAFTFNEMFGLDLKSFLLLDRDGEIDVFKALLCNIREKDTKVEENLCRLKAKISGLENDLAKSSQVNLTEMKNELVLAKLALADKDIKLFEITSGANSQVPKLSAKPPSVSQPLVIASGSSR